MSNQMKHKQRFRPAKFRSLVRYVIQEQAKHPLQPMTLERLHVTLYLIEFEHFKRFGRGISNPTFIRGNNYPECLQLEQALQQLLQDGSVTLLPSRDYFSMV